MPKKFPPEFKRDVVAVARRADTTLTETAADFDISTSTLKRWMAQADIDDGVRGGGVFDGRGGDVVVAAAGPGERRPQSEGERCEEESDFFS